MSNQADILFVVPRGLRRSRSGFPFGIAILAAILKRNNFNVRVIDANAFSLTTDEVVQKILELGPGIVCFTGLWVDFPFQKEVSINLRAKAPLIRQIAGGWWASPVPYIVFEETAVDFIVRGEADLIISDICREVLDGKHTQIQGVCSRDNKGVYCAEGPAKAPVNLDLLPTPAYELFSMEYYTEKVRLRKSDIYTLSNNNIRYQISMYTGRGCYGRCHFCSAAGIHRRNHSPKYVIDHMERVYKEFGADYFFFNESLTLSTKTWVKDFCRELIARELKVLYAAECRGDFIYDEETLSLLHESGCVKAIIGFESGDNEMLKNMGKHARLEQYNKLIQDFRKYHMDIFGSFILNMPGETKSSLRNTIQFIKHAKIPVASGFASPYPGTKFYEYCIENKNIEDERIFIKNNPGRDKGRGDFSEYYRQFNFNKLSAKILYETQKKIDKIGLINNYYYRNRLVYWILSLFPWTYGILEKAIKLKHALRKI